MAKDEAYRALVAAIERLHRHFLDVLRAELLRLEIGDVNAVQALLVHNIGSNDVIIRDLRDRGYYHGSNVSYNIKKLTELGYVEQERNSHDRRSVRLRLTARGTELSAVIGRLQSRLVERLHVTEDELAAAGRTLRALEKTWATTLRDEQPDDAG